jgi:hypothetical protein
MLKLIIAALIVDTFSLKVYDLYSKDPTSNLRIFAYIIISLIYCIGQYVHPYNSFITKAKALLLREDLIPFL